ncbi:hypothetical protein M513_07874 [Trichuris suis]|uniref:Uncharacterized protein n=1 Tax=Trichuris suis TaxID=68888 RepID=A0A085M228_9BILA|nr:hypothetical protein M513_07874 [Trichuris suis]
MDSVITNQSHKILTVRKRAEGPLGLSEPAEGRLGQSQRTDNPVDLALSVTVDTFTIAELDVLVSPTLKRRADGIAKSNRLSEASDQICDRSR